MLDRVAVNKEITEKEILAVLFHVNGDMKKSNAQAMRTLYKKLPDELKYSGLIYRGLSVSLDDLQSLLSNASFQGQSKDQYNVESWSYNAGSAKRFMYVSPYHIAIMLERQIGIDDALMILSGALVDYLEKTVDHRIIEAAMNQLGYTMKREWPKFKQTVMLEKEVILPRNQSASYTLCQDVVSVKTHHTFFFERREFLAPMLIEKLDEQSKEFVEKNQSEAVALEYVFRCDGQGNLQVQDYRKV